MGRSEPSFAHEECSLIRFIRDEARGSIIEKDLREEDLALLDAVANEPDLDDEDALKLSLQKYKARVLECWSVGDFVLNATQPDGTTVRHFHFLEYSGTRQLAADIWTMRWLLNAPKMHLYGISYGTTVFSTYATIFPSYVGLFILDSNTVSFLSSLFELETAPFLTDFSSLRNRARFQTIITRH